MQAKGMGSVVSLQSPVVSCYQLLAISFQPSAISYQLSATNYQPLPVLKGTGFSRSEKVENPAALAAEGDSHAVHAVFVVKSPTDFTGLRSMRERRTSI
jgi:hypothetical protein